MVVHLQAVAECAARFAGAFDASAWGKLLGLWHDVGKASREFQAYLLRENGYEAHLETRSGKVDHSTAGAQHAEASFPNWGGRILAHCIAGHHAGLLNAEGTPGLRDRLTKQIPAYGSAPTELLNQSQPAKPPMQWLGPFDASVFCRMLFSCLVDADFLATERFMRPDQAAARPQETPAAALLPELDSYLAKLQSDATDTHVNRLRADVLRQCREKASLPPGLFSLTVPTGGGKTLSSLAFALRHAAEHDLRRVIYAIPFTSIIEQNVDVFREALGERADEAVLEHHSNLDPEEETVWGRLAAENWEASLVVTTNVQLFESLFANRTSRCRKLHRIARSVIILDECQTLPIELLKPTLAMLDVLRRNYGCTIVLCTATQPAILHRDDFKIGLKDVREIIDDPRALYTSLKRVEVERAGRLEDEQLVAQLAECERVLCIVNTKKHAAALFKGLQSAVGDEGVFHLSANMCPAHRTDVLTQIRERLSPEDSRPCRVISTQLVEAGVDLDFPVVYRALAGLDSIAQAAGRCNREGRQRTGRVVVFETDVRPTPAVRSGADHTSEVAQAHDDLLGLNAIEAYFRLHYWSQSDRWDEKQIMPCFAVGGERGLHFQFRQAAESYSMIPDAQQPILVPYDEKGRKLINQLCAMPEPPGRGWDRKLQRYVVGVYDRDFRTLRENQVIAQYHERFWVLQNEDAYNAQRGLTLDVSGFSPESMVV